MAYSLERQILDDIAKARLNEYYYKRLAKNANRWDLGLRIATACSSGGALASLLGSAPSSVAQVLSGIAVVAAVVSPLLRLPEAIKMRSALATQWADLGGQLEDIVLLPEGGARKAEMFATLHSRGGKLQGLDPDPPVERLTKPIWEQVKVELSDRYATTY